MAEPNRCPQCGSPLPLDAPPGICPRCVLRLGFRRLPAGSPVAARGNQQGPREQAPLAATSPASPGGRFVPPKPQELESLFPQLEILNLLGQGGMGAVYKARQSKLDRLVALKILPPEVGQDPAFAERFAREARTLGRLNHPGIVGIYDFGQAGNLYYLLMEYVDGSNLRQVIEAGKLAPAEALAIVPQVCEALQYAHDEGIVHRDIKPENILLDKKGRAKIADFGLAKLLSRPAGSFTLTDTQQVMGTPHYMAPEQLASTHAVDHRADIYSLGVVFYEMLTGELPLGRFEPPSKRAGVDARLDEVVLRTLERTPERRYQQASQVKTDVETIAQVPCLPPKPAETAIPSPAPFAWHWFAVGLGLLLPTLALIAFALFWTQSAWALAALAAPWFVLGSCGGYTSVRRFEQVVEVLAVVLFLFSLGLIGYGVWLEGSIIPLTAVLACGAAAMGGGAIGYGIKEEKAKPAAETATNSVAEPAAVDADDDDEEEAVTPEGAVATPATWMAIVGGIGSWWLFSGVADVVQAIVSRRAIPDRLDLLLLVVAPLVLAGGLLGRAMRGYWLVVVASVLCLPVGLASHDFPVRAVPFGIGIWMLVVLSRAEVRAAFRQHAPNASSDELGPDGWPIKPAMPSTAPVAKHSRGTLGRAWDEWWGKRDQWFTGMVQAVLAIIAIGLWTMFLSFNLSTKPTPGDDKLRHTIVNFGTPDPWFHLEKYPEPLVPFRWTINYFSWSTLLLVLGCLAWYFYWQIEKAKPEARWLWIGAPNTIIIFWGILSSLIVVIGILLVP